MDRYRREQRLGLPATPSAEECRDHVVRRLEEWMKDARRILWVVERAAEAIAGRLDQVESRIATLSVVAPDAGEEMAKLREQHQILTEEFVFVNYLYKFVRVRHQESTIPDLVAAIRRRVKK